MQKNLHSDGRLSFTRPNAESTMNGTFQWGRKNFNNSTISQHNKTAKSPPRNLVKVDARVYTDVQSRGLASRIVKYHENGTRFNRSISMTNLSGKSNSPLSVKKLEAKPQLRYDKAVKQNVSMTHIAPPDKSLFYGNTLSGLLRSSSVIALSQSDDDLSSENRPIIHPPVTEKELQPTRSVLEVLKEISRKRINNEVLQDNDDVVDTSKKYCGRFVDAAHFSGHNYRLQQIHLQTPQALPPQSTPPTTTYKRQRESADGYGPSHCLSRDANCFPTKLQQPELPTSPEQQSKRRFYNYNNDITSSLSSSAISSTAKRKLCEHDGYMRQEKVLRYQSEVRLPEISAAFSYANKLPITPLPNTPQTVSKESPITIAQQVQKSASEPIPSTTTKQQEQSQTVKPKLTLFNRNYETKMDESEEQATLDANEDDNAYARISFVKPKKAASSIGGPSASNLVMERTRKSKLALMLSGLRGEIYLGDEEEQQRLKGETKEDKAKEVTEISLPTAATILTATTTTSIDKPDASEQTKPPETTVAVSAAISTPITTSSNKITSPLTGIKLTPITTTAACKEQSATIAPTFNFIPPSSTATSTTAVAPAETSKPNFSFGLSAPTANSTPATSTAAAPSFSFGLSAKTATNTTAPTMVPASTTASTILNFNFNSTAKTDSTAATTNTSTAPLPAAFNFGSKITTNATANSTTTSTTAVSSTTTTSGFSFGCKTDTNNATSNAPTTTASTTPAFTFGGLTAASQTANKPGTATTTTATTTAFNFVSQQPAAAFSFGASAVTTTATTCTTNEPPKMFSFSAAPAATNTTAGGNFAFGSNTSATANITAQGTTPFSGAVANPQSITSPPSFGDAKNAAPTPNTFMFGAKPATQTATVAPLQPAFGGNQESKTTPAANFSFGGINSTPKPTFGASNANNLFGVNTNNNNTQAATTTNEVAKPNNAFSFSSAAQQSKPFAFGAANTTNATNDPTKSTNLFGAALTGSNQQNKTFSFGSQIAPQPTATNPQSASSTFNFSNPNQAGNNATNNNNNNTSNAFAFGAGGNNNANKTAITNAFGAAVPTNNKPNTSAFTFGQANQSNNNGIFNFSAAAKSAPTNNANNLSATINQPSTASNTFASVASSGGFVFGGASKTATPSFGTPSASNTPSGGGFVFGAQAQQNNSTVQPAAGNLFASTGAPPPAAAVTSQSNNLFGGGSANTSSASNIFGGNANATPAFGATSPPATNVFAISSTSGSEQRPIRRATRRLPKP